MKQLTKDQAIRLYEGGWWLDCNPDEIVRLQLYQNRLCMPIDVFHEALKEVLGRPVYNIEFAGYKLIDEYEGKHPAPTFEEIMSLIPADKQVIVILPDSKDQP